MATNNYYGFTHGGTQYTNQYTTQQSANQGYTTPQQQYTHAPPANTAATPQQTQAYTAESYVISGYTRPAGQATQAAQSYYPQQNQQQTYSTPIASAKPAAVARPAAASTTYPSYSANTAGTTSSSYAGFSHQTTTQAPTKSTGFTNYDAAVYNAVTAYAQGGSSGAGRGQGLGYKRTPGHHMNKLKGPRPAPKPQALHYCDVCKISCAGPQTYKEHLEGQKHKKKEAAQKAGMPTVSKGTPAGLRCELCDVTCTGSDAYAAHIRGAKHQKVLKLHTKLGKPIPSDSPTVIASPAANTPAQQSTQPAGSVLKQVPITNSSGQNSQQTNASANISFAKPVTPKINFIGPKTDFDRYTTNANANSAPDNSGESTTSQISTTFTAPVSAAAAANGGQAQQTADASKSTDNALYMEKDIQPVGQDYIEEVRSDDGKVVSFNCKLCECRFNDPNAKEMHMKGRRHRLQYKKKVNPDLVVDVKPSSRQKKIEERRSARNTTIRRGQQEAFPRGPPVPLIPPGGPRGFGPGPAYGGPNPLFFIPPLIRRPESMEDRHVMAKHAEIYPKEEELHAIQKIVSNTEKALKFVSDNFADTDSNVVNGIKTEVGTEPTTKSEAELQASRILKGVMRVGHLAKGLLLKGDRSVQLVVLCSERPTVSMLNRVADGLPKQLLIVAPEETYDVQKKVENAAIIVSSTMEPKIEVTVTLTSPLLRTSGQEAVGEAQATEVTDPPGLLDKEKCLDALAALRHAKWFQARATALQSCVIVIRILRDLCQRVAAWHSLSCWAVELLTEKAINSAGIPISPGEALRLVLEVVSAGVILSTGPGLLDPCEKESIDALDGLTAQEREGITAFGQMALRQIAFRQIHKVLGIEPLPRFVKKGLFNTRKRRRNNSAGGEPDENEAGNDGKKDKKEEVMETDKVEIKAEG